MSTPKSINVLATIALLILYGAPNVDAASSDPIDGIYSGSSTYYRFPGPTASKPLPLFGAISADGNGYFISTPAAGRNIQFFRNLNKLGKSTSLQYEVPTGGQAVSRGPRNWRFEIKPTGDHLHILHGTFNNVSGYVAISLKKQALTRQKVSLKVERGIYHSVSKYQNNRTSIKLASDGTMSGTDNMGCHIAGKLLQLDDLNLFKSAVTFSGRASCRGHMSGISFFDMHDLSGQNPNVMPYLYIIGVNDDLSQGFSMVLMRQDK